MIDNLILILLPGIATCFTAYLVKRAILEKISMEKEITEMKKMYLKEFSNILENNNEAYIELNNELKENTDIDLKNNKEIKTEKDVEELVNNNLDIKIGLIGLTDVLKTRCKIENKEKILKKVKK